MLRAAFFPDFKGSNTLLIWGNNSDIARLSHGLRELCRGERLIFEVEGGQGLSSLQVRIGRGDRMSQIVGSEDALEWVCSPTFLEKCLGMIEPLLSAAADHQYVDAQGGLADRAMIAVNEYPDDFRR